MKLNSFFGTTAITLFLIVSHNLKAQSWSLALKDTGAVRVPFTEKFPSPNQDYGCAVAVYGNYAVVGAAKEAYDLKQENKKYDAGACYILENKNGEWSQTQKLIVSDRAANDRLGGVVAMYGDYLVVTAMGKKDAKKNMGCVYIFKNEGGLWKEMQKIVSPDTEKDLSAFGGSLSLYENRLLIGSSSKNKTVFKEGKTGFEGAAYIFENKNGKWELVQKLTAAKANYSAHFGLSVAQNKECLFIGAPYEKMDAGDKNKSEKAGAIYVFKLVGNKWEEKQKIVASDRAKVQLGSIGSLLGKTVAVWENTLVAGAPYTYDKRDTLELTTAGAAYVFENKSGVWTETQKLKSTDGYASNAFYGEALSMYKNTLVVGARLESKDPRTTRSDYEAGLVYIYKKAESGFELVQKIGAIPRKNYEQFGRAVAVWENTIVAGGKQTFKRKVMEHAKLLDVERGSAYVYSYTNCNYTEITTTYLKDAKKGLTYSVQLKMTGLDNPKFSVSSGKLPNGITLSPEGLLNGIPTEDGESFIITFSAKEGSCSASKELKLKVRP